eukprot:3252732-Amphidinium_carterae.1
MPWWQKRDQFLSFSPQAMDCDNPRNHYCRFAIMTLVQKRFGILTLTGNLWHAMIVSPMHTFNLTFTQPVSVAGLRETTNRSASMNAAASPPIAVGRHPQRLTHSASLLSTNLPHPHAMTNQYVALVTERLQQLMGPLRTI